MLSSKERHPGSPLAIQWLGLTQQFHWGSITGEGTKDPASCVQFSSVQFSCSVVSDYLWSHGLQHARLPCPSPTPGACKNSYTLSWWCQLTILSCCPLLLLPSIFPSIRSFPVSHFFTSGGQSNGVSASVLPVNIQDWFPLELTGLISVQSKGLSRVFSSTTVQKQAVWCDFPQERKKTASQTHHFPESVYFQ